MFLLHLALVTSPLAIEGRVIELERADRNPLGSEVLSPPALTPVVMCGSVAYLSLHSADETVSNDGLWGYLVCN